MNPAMFSGVVPGEYVLLAMLVWAALAAVFLLPAAVWWWYRPPRRPALPAAAYLAVTALCLWGSHADGGGVMWVFVAALTMPWLVIPIFAAGSSGPNLGFLSPGPSTPASGMWFLGASVLANAALIYGAAWLAGRLRRARIGRGAG